ncbi:MULTISPECIES: hypothetical protein [Aquitalea]|uniref:Transmembrane protein n=1 Tax=Aquitalea magnusonii TaxID=332411 RepID=A0A318JHP0_9NEIS|nr:MULTISPECIES: hypothetical protein [Aquitalea]PXX48338.1 hypothetical protein DFR38_107123 [Aquitalea magnusonii]
MFYRLLWRLRQQRKLALAGLLLATLLFVLCAACLSVLDFASSPVASLLCILLMLPALLGQLLMLWVLLQKP